MTFEAEVVSSKIELATLKEQTTGWEVEISQLNADLASKSPKISNFLFSGITDIPITDMMPCWHRLHPKCRNLLDHQIRIPITHDPVNTYLLGYLESMH
jgi:hypothetical protein